LPSHLFLRPSAGGILGTLGPTVPTGLPESFISFRPGDRFGGMPGLGRRSEMRNSASNNWRAARVTRVNAADEPTTAAPLIRGRGNLATGERPGPDGIRWGLVNRVKAEIAAGIYDSEEKLFAATNNFLQQYDRE
jgi:hypothetical protein